MNKKIAVYGLGHLGLPLAVVLARAEYDVLGIDPSPQLERAPEPGIKAEELGKLQCYTDPQPSDVSFVVVPTPSTKQGDFDTQYVARCLGQISAVNGPDHLAVLVSTVSPGTCSTLASIAAMDNITLVYNPTFIALGDVINGLVRPDLLLIASPDNAALEAVATIWSTVFRKVKHQYDSPTHLHFAEQYEEVELLKLAVNAYLGTKISLANSLGTLFAAYDVDPAAVAAMEYDPRIGKGYLTPGSPITGPCLPRDNKALHHAAMMVDVALPLSDATEEIQAQWYEDFLAKVLVWNPESIGIIGMSYKEGLDVDTDSVGSFLKEVVGTTRVVKTYDSVLPSDDYEDVLKCDVIVVTQKGLLPVETDKPVISLWT